MRGALGCARAQVRSNQVAKGDVLTVAQLAGIMGAKATSSLVPLCHPLSLSKVGSTGAIQDARVSALLWGVRLHAVLVGRRVHACMHARTPCTQLHAPPNPPRYVAQGMGWQMAMQTK